MRSLWIGWSKGCLWPEKLAFKQKTGVNIPDLKLEYFHFIPNDFLQKSCILPIFLENQSVFDNYCAIFPHLKETLIKHICNPLTLHFLELDKVFHFLIIGKYPASIENMNFIREITRICEKENIEDLIVLNFDSLCLSKQSFEKCCLVPQLKIFFVDSDLLYSRIFNLETKVKNKMRVSAWDIVAQTSELSESPGQLLNILLDCPDIIKQLRDLADEMHLEDNGLTSLWSMNSNEIESFHERVEPYQPIVF